MKRLKSQSIIVIFFCFVFSSCSRLSHIANYSDPFAPLYVKQNLSILPVNNENIKVVSYNIDLCKKILLAKKILEENKELSDADIICLQEMNLEAVEYLANNLKYNYVYCPAAIHPGNKKDFGQAILSKWPIKEYEKTLLPHTKEDRYIKLQRIAVSATILINSEEVAVVSAHLGVMITPPERKEQTYKIIASLPADATYIIIAGDFNTYTLANKKTVLAAFKEAGFQFATKDIGWTYKYWYLLNKKVTLDHIFSKGLKLIKAGKVMKRNSSDHIPIWAEFAFPSP